MKNLERKMRILNVYEQLLKDVPHEHQSEFALLFLAAISDDAVLDYGLYKTNAGTNRITKD